MRVEFRRQVSGDLVVRRTQGEWRGRVGEFEARAALNGVTVLLEFAGGSGVFRGKLTDDGSEIDGFWLSQPGEANGLRDPGGTGQPFVSPLVLNRADKNRWKGRIPSFPEQFSLYLKVFKRDDGALRAAFRNPEANSIGGVSRFLIRRKGDEVAFGLPGENGDFDLKGEARLLHGPDRIRLFWPDLNGEIELHRANDKEATGFCPRPSRETRYRYRKPADLGDGWKTARAKDVGLDEKALGKAVQAIVDADPAALRPPLIHSLLIARRGKLVLDEYFFGFDAKTPHDLRSASKTFSSVMLGATMREGVSISPETKLYDLVADMGPFAHPDAGKAKITLADLMTHTSGLACDDNDEASPGNEETMQSQEEEPNWWKYALDSADGS